MLNALRLRNFRSSPNDDKASFVHLKPITVLLGKNSSGKSSFLRSLPLLRQSVEAKTTGPILWFGSYVDFGAFSEVKPSYINTGQDETIYFDFNLNINLVRLRRFGAYPIRKNTQNEIENVEVELGVSESKNKTILSSLKINILENEYLFKFVNDIKCSLFINGEKSDIGDLDFFNVDSFFPVIGKLEKRKGLDEEISYYFEDSILEKHFSSKLEARLKRFFNSNTNSETIKRGVDKCKAVSSEKLASELRSIYRDSRSFTSRVSDNYRFPPDLHTLVVNKELSSIIRSISDTLESCFKGVRYVAPLRATAERYYRHQDLKIDEIDHTGSNLAMLLRSFTYADETKFQSWTKENFGFSVRLEELGLHYALKIKVDDEIREYNINDMGFGFSQILPIVTAIWMELEGDRSTLKRSQKQSIIFAIEQPELHLHPEYQAKLAKIFAKVIKSARSSGLNFKIIFETHSKTMVDTLGESIEEGLLNSDDINISLFEKDSESGNTTVSFSSFNDEGYLLKWPIGFFSGSL